MPYDCRHYLTGEPFNFKNPNHINRWNELKKDSPHPSEFEEGISEMLEKGYSAWIDNKTNESWIPTDMHTKTTLTAFPELVDQTHTKEFKKKWRYLGKATNFAKNYGCGPATLADNLDIDLETATKLSDAYNQAYPGVIGYQNETQGELALKGYSTNLYDRKYYIVNSNNGYKVNNYRIQGRVLLPLSI